METGVNAQILVKASYKTGEYVGEAVDRDDRRTLVKVLAVLRHPTQGDLHHPYDPDVPIFHERRALAYTEKVWVPNRDAEPYDGAAPDYADSLRRALDEETERIDKLNRWAAKSLEQLASLRKDYRY